MPDHPDEGARVRHRHARGIRPGLRRRERNRVWRKDERRNLSGEGALGRGTQLSRPGVDSRTVTQLRFELDTRVRAGKSDEGWRYLPSTVNIEGPGCYGLQIDGPGWTSVIVMRAFA